jgi:Siphovirus Gp157
MKPREAEALRLEIENLIRAFPEIAEDEILRADMLSGETSIDEVITDLIRMEEDARALRDGTNARLMDLKARVERFGRRIEFTRALMAAILNSAGLKKKELPEATVYLRNNAPSLLGFPDGDKLPDDLVKIERKPDKAKIREALQAGRALDVMVK